jgi:DNA modification methylase
MRTFIRLKNRHANPLPKEFRDQELRYAPELVATFVQRFTRTGDTVFDPFAGYGTTLAVTEQMGRVPFGIEYDAARVEYIRTLLRDPAAIIQGDSRRLREYPVPLFDLCMTSPPFTERNDTFDALTNYRAPSTGYSGYLRDLAAIYAQIRQFMKPNARVVLEVSNLQGPTGVTTLAWDVARSIGEVLHFEGEVVVGWDSYGYGYDHSYCLIFRAPDR